MYLSGVHSTGVEREPLQSFLSPLVSVCPSRSGSALLHPAGRLSPWATFYPGFSGFSQGAGTDMRTQVSPAPSLASHRWLPYLGLQGKSFPQLLVPGYFTTHYWSSQLYPALCKQCFHQTVSANPFNVAGFACRTTAVPACPESLPTDQRKPSCCQQ